MINSVLKLPRKETESAIGEDFRAAELYKNFVFFFRLKILMVNLQVRDLLCIWTRTRLREWPISSV